MLNSAMVLLWAKQVSPDKPALISGNSQYSYSDLNTEVLRVAHLLMEKGTKKGDLVALFLPNSIEFVASYFAVLRVGAVAVPINRLASDREIGHILADSGAAAVITSPDSSDRISAVTTAEVRQTVRVHGVSIGRGHSPSSSVPSSGDQATVHGQENLAGATKPDDPAVVLYTSGTTGAPKGVVLSHLSITWIAEAVATSTLRATDRDVFLCALPLTHIFGLVAVMSAALFSGSTLVLQERFDPDESLDLMRTYGVTVFEGVPAMCTLILQAAAKPGHSPAPVLRVAMLGGQSAPLTLVRDFRRVFGCPVVECYGATETGSAICATPLDGALEDYAGTVGRPLTGVEVQIRDDTGGIAAPGEIGEIAVRSVGNMSGYRGDAASGTMRDGWVLTGDMGSLRDDGVLSIAGRKKELIIRGGYNVYPRELEELLYQHPSILEAAVIGIPDDVLGEEIAAVVVLKPGSDTTEEEIQNYLKNLVALYKYPRVVCIVPSLPKSATGKISKKLIDRQSLKSG
jgi:long-chain acyl-CoA synthetase